MSTETEGEGEAPMSLEQLLAENERLEQMNRELEEENIKLHRQVRWSESTTSYRSEESKITVGQTQVFNSSVETMRAMFLQFDNSRPPSGYIAIDCVPALHHKLGEMISDEDGESIKAQLREVARGNVLPYAGSHINFDQFLTYWIQDRPGTENRSKFKLVSLDLFKTGSFQMRRIRRDPRGKEGTFAYRIFYYYAEKETGERRRISPWHDIPLYHVGEGVDAQLVSFLCEIPKWTRAKYEIATKERFNPIRQDLKNGKLRYYQYGDMPFNYGLFPQTWEDPNHVSTDTGARGDNDPIDAIEIGTRQFEVGEVQVVKVLGILGLIDDDETDWKVICISIQDPLAPKLNDVDDVEECIPGCISAIREYFRIYKSWAPTGGTAGDENYFSFGEMAKPRDYAMKVIWDTHLFWRKLRDRSLEGVVNTPLHKKVSDDVFDDEE